MGTRAAVAVLFVLALGGAVFSDQRTDDNRVRASALPSVLATLALAAPALAVEIGSPSGVPVVVTRVAVVGVAAYTYDRTEPLVTPPLVYATFAVASTVLRSSVFTAVLGT